MGRCSAKGELRTLRGEARGKHARGKIFLPEFRGIPWKFADKSKKLFLEIAAEKREFCTEGNRAAVSAMKGPSEDERRRTDAYKLAMYHTALDAHVAASGAPSGVQTRKAMLVLDGVPRERDVRAIVGSAAAVASPDALLGMLRDAGSFLEAECARLLAVPARGYLVPRRA